LLYVPDEILRCPKCGELLVDSGKRNLLGLLLFFAGFLTIVGLQHFYGPNVIRDLVILVVSVVAYGMVRKLAVTKKDYIIRNMDTNRISYIDQADWDEIIHRETLILLLFSITINDGKETYTRRFTRTEKMEYPNYLQWLGADHQAQQRP
jgi:hypothetical protein